MENTVKKYAVFRHPNNVLVGIEPDGFTVVKLAEDYGSGTYDVTMFVNGKVEARYHQIVDDRLGPPKNMDPLPVDALPVA